MNDNAPLGVRLNNPGNLKITKDKWQGLADVQGDQTFFTFKSAVYGIRAIARTLITYQDERRINTIPAIISTWSPPSENQTTDLIANALKRTGFDAKRQLDMHNYADLKAMVLAIMWQEIGKPPYSAQEIDKALVLAGVEPERKPLPQTQTMRGAQVTATAGAVAAASGVVAQAAPAVPVLHALAEAVQQNALGMLVIIGMMVFAAAAYIAWERIQERRKGIA